MCCSSVADVEVYGDSETDAPTPAAVATAPVAQVTHTPAVDMDLLYMMDALTIAVKGFPEQMDHAAALRSARQVHVFVRSLRIFAISSLAHALRAAW